MLYFEDSECPKRHVLWVLMEYNASKFVKNMHILSKTWLPVISRKLMIVSVTEGCLTLSYHHSVVEPANELDQG
jgi:hypothetical protein